MPSPDTHAGSRAGSVEDPGALVLLANRTSSRTSATGGPALPLRDGVRVYFEGLPDAAADRYAQVVASPAEAEVAVLRAIPDRHNRWPADDVDRVLDLAATVPTIVVLQLAGPAPVPEFAGDGAAVLVDLGVADTTVAEVVFGRHAPGGHLPFALPNPDGDDGTAPGDGYPAGFGLTY
ncbi:glycoside hydrolase family 3 C-terminal domain-containing protein [Uniformispora flossi]|uniref:glycoside hydrolase family 3 C-terminal domain-containing protein n=1 Tax=Uniformispora flossi TaxID=3390723 RepID=UPI003C2D1F1D